MNGIELRQHELESRILGNARCVWTQPPPREASGAPRALLVFLDAEYYLTHVGAVATVDRMQRRGDLPPLLTAYVSHRDHEIRWPESFCNPDFAACLTDELLPWLGAGWGGGGCPREGPPSRA